MKKYGKLIFTALSVAAFAGGAYYFVKNILNKDSDDDFDDFEDDFDDFDVSDDTNKTTSDSRGYVTININDDNDSTEVVIETEDTSDSAEEDDNVQTTDTEEISDKTENAKPTDEDLVVEELPLD